MKYSFVIPCYNSEATIKVVVSEIFETMQSHNELDFEIILVNDYSKDGTENVIFNLSNENTNVTAITMSKNFGQHSALLAGYSFTSGDIVISLDDDGQTPANQVYDLINKLEEGYDVIFAKYPDKQHNFMRNLGSKLNDVMANKLMNKPKNLYLSSYFVARKYIINEMLKYNSPYPYISGLVLRTTASISNVNVKHRNREIGKSGYTFTSLIKLWLNGFTAFSIKPLRISVYIGIIAAFFGLLLLIYSLVNWLNNPMVPQGWTSMIATTAILGGIILAVLGMIGEYIGRIYMSLNETPQYVIKKTSRDNNHEEK
ncbi:glycosyltransferase family 2 protein [Anaerorhabdus furcosa]|uniref:Undecaprenyl-phosphate 4-deoxy-4-formamido-L-arabinose transferase n=1 Tax=Anaerorhabdus furcosa TaxID=118967 RepID=A0A1T4LUR2_9FIRM|nr:glycosyltransferase family 2 protein [Anaerorhabdus furcosa]SJZ58480.1 undecaprenyl-phosphate 4-deoxy-4-formamido-L-arabinose transferase [Anaerorhabdus furcosa]